MSKKKNKKTEANPFITKIIVRIITIILLVGIFVGAAYFVMERMTKVETQNKHALVDKQLSLCQELVTAKYKYSDIITLKKSSGFAKSYSIVKYSGILRAGISSLSNIVYEIPAKGKKIEITLPPVEVLGNELLTQEIFDEKQSIFVPITTQEIFDEIEIARKEAEAEILEEGMLDEAREYAERVVTQLMYSLGFEEVVIK